MFAQRTPCVTESSARAAAAREDMNPVVARAVALDEVDNLEPGAGQQVAQVARLPPREESPGEVVVRERAFAVARHHREVRGRAERERVVQLHERPREPVTRHVEVARARPRAAERTAAERECLEVSLDTRNIGARVARESHHRERSVERERGPGQIREVQSSAATEVCDHGARRDGVTQQLGTIEVAGRACVAPLTCPLLVHRDGVAIHVRSIAISLPEAR